MSDGIRDYGVLDYPDRFISGSYGLLRDNFRVLVIVAAFGWLAIEAGLVDAPNVGLEVPLWARVILVFGAVAAVGGHWVGSNIFDQPEPDWNYIVEVNIHNPVLLRIRKVTDAVLEDFTVVGGTFGNPDGTPIYFCRFWNHDIENPVAICSWDELPSDTELLGMQPSSVVDEIHSMRSSYEETIYKADYIESHFPIIVRRLQSEKAKSLNDALEGHLAPNLGEGAGTIDSVIDDVVPDELLPEHFRERVENQDELGANHTQDVVEDTDDPMQATPDPETPELTGDVDGAADSSVATDGGQTDE